METGGLRGAIFWIFRTNDRFGHINDAPSPQIEAIPESFQSALGQKCAHKKHFNPLNKSFAKRHDGGTQQCNFALTESTRLALIILTEKNTLCNYNLIIRFTS